MRFKGDVKKMPDNPTYGRIGTDGLFEVTIEYDDGGGSITNWRHFETTAQSIPYEEGNRILSKRLNELRAQHAHDDKS